MILSLPQATPAIGAGQGTVVFTATPRGNRARRVVIVPGYGMAVAQAQHDVRQLADLLEERGVDVRYAIHPVAGRMPGHMNVLLAEANVPYTQLSEMDEINPEFPQTDVALVIGVPLLLATGVVEWAPRETLGWRLAAEFAGTALGIFFATALGEELCFRGILQNLLEKTLRRPLVAQSIAAAAFGAVHLSFRFYPNWGFALASAVALRCFAASAKPFPAISDFRSGNWLPR